MSSHHIVRDDQEPALILNHPNPDDRVVLQLMEWSPLLVCLPLSFSFVVEKQQWVDVFVSYENEIPPVTSIPAKAIYLSPDQFPDVLKYSIDLLIQKGHLVIHIYTNITGEMMLELAEKYSGIEIIFFDGEARHIPCLRGIFEKWYAVGQKIKVSPSIDHDHNDEIDWYGVDQDGFLKLNHSAPFLLSEYLNI